jgi:type IV pilus assembly protein PilV
MIAMHRSRRGPQQGITLLESLIAMAVLAIGLLGLAGAQIRVLAELRNTVARATAVSLIDDLAHRISLNPEAATRHIVGNQNGGIGIDFPYALAWDGAIPVGPDCASADCTAIQSARHDLRVWSSSVSASLTGGVAHVFQSSTDRRQIGVVIAWRPVSNKAEDGDVERFNAPFKVSAAAHGVNCPDGFLCHLTYIQP